MKNQQIPEHKMNFTGEVSEALDNMDNNDTNREHVKKEAGAKRNNLKEK
ncbi:hypothetical protein [Metabacillus arenae]|uniref:Uncharacterized protein n=1 Tax=Metabacillus arenae TaxID=2771434 RepID=A0A926RY42_9BACI|nr:hypothetical protein [Metabacillus arenae]MBD1381335.1 hypothetical protein [Metabacillus arenae]